MVWALLLALPQGIPLGAGAKGGSCSFSFPRKGQAQTQLQLSR